MPLTGLPLIVLSLCCTAMVAAATVWLWGRAWSVRLVVRTAGVVLTEALLLISIGLVVNRHEDFFPSWDTLFTTSKAEQPTYRTVAGSLDAQLAAAAASRGTQPQLFPWRPAGWAGWRLAAMPTLVIPAGYLQHPQWRYSVVLVVGSAADGWPAVWRGPAALRVAADASRDVVAFVTTTPGTAVQTLTSALPDELRHDLRVTEHRWAVVTAQADAAAVRQAVLQTPWQYPAVAVVQHGGRSARAVPTARSTAGRRPAVRPQRVRRRASAAGKLPVVERSGTAADDAVDFGVPAGISTIAVRPGAAPASLLTSLTGAVRWAAGQTPPPLAASSPPVKYLPVQPHRRSGTKRRPSGAAHAGRGRGRVHGTGQSRH